MYIQPINTQYRAVQNNNFKDINFKASVATAIRDTFVSTRSREKEPKKSDFGGRISELKPYNVDFMTTLKIARLPKSDYDTVLREIRENPAREAAVKEGKSKLTFERDNKDRYYENMDEIKTDLSYTEDGGGYSSLKLRTRKGENKLDIRRKEEVSRNKHSSEMVDTSAFNHKYKIKNRFKELITTGEYAGRSISRNISIKDAAGRMLLNYNFAKSTLNNSNLSKTVINGREYTTKVGDDGKVRIVSGRKASEMDLLSRLDTESIRSKGGNPAIEDAIIESKKANFVKALRLLPPQILCQADEDFDTFKNGLGGADGRTLEVNLYCPESAARSLINGTVENLVIKKGLTEEKELKEIFAKERENYINWLNEDKENCLIMSEEHHLGELVDPETDLMATIKKICALLWTEEYEKSGSKEESMHLLLNFFPKSVSYIVSKFELNDL